MSPEDVSLSPTDPQSDPDFISETGIPEPGINQAYVESLRPQAMQPGPSWSSFGSPTPVYVPKESTPFEKQDDGGPIPHAALWALKYLRHGGFWGGAEATIRERHGQGDSTIYVIDDGRKHCVVCRAVGSSPDGCAYFLVGRITLRAYEELLDNETSAQRIFGGAADLSLCVVYEAADAVSNVAVVESFGNVGDVPAMYLPPSPLIEFEDSSDSDV